MGIFSQTEREMDIGLNFAHFVLVGEFAGWSPAFLPLYYITNKYKDDINSLEPFDFWAILIPLVTVLLYWVHGFFYYLFADRDENFKSYKVQDKKSPPNSDLSHIIMKVLRNQFLIWIPLCVILGISNSEFWTDSTDPIRPISTADSLYHYVVYIVLDEILFFYLHWLCHAFGPLYQYVHKVHHTYSAPFALAADYCHPVEHILVNILPPLAGCLIMHSDQFTIFVWLSQIQLVRQVNHSGYRFLWRGIHSTSDFHDGHHRTFLKNYGTLGILDYLHGTLA